MIPEFDQDGTLPPGMHPTNEEELRQRFGGSHHRDGLMSGILSVLHNLQEAGCQRAFLDGSFVTNKTIPNDFDLCWDGTDVNRQLIDPVLLDFSNGRAAQKAKYGGESFPSSRLANLEGAAFLDFFQTNRETGARKGIVLVEFDSFWSTESESP